MKTKRQEDSKTRRQTDRMKIIQVIKKIETQEYNTIGRQEKRNTREKDDEKTEDWIGLSIP